MESRRSRSKGNSITPGHYHAITKHPSKTYRILSLGYIINAVAAHYLFGEAVSVTRWLGIGFIVLGVWLVART